MEEIRLGDLNEQEIYDLLKKHEVIPVMCRHYKSNTYGIIKQLTDDDLISRNRGQAGTLQERIWLFSNSDSWDGGWNSVIKVSSFGGYNYAFAFEPGEFGNMILFKTQTLYDLIIE